MGVYDFIIENQQLSQKVIIKSINYQQWPSQKFIEWAKIAGNWIINLFHWIYYDSLKEEINLKKGNLFTHAFEPL